MNNKENKLYIPGENIELKQDALHGHGIIKKDNLLFEKYIVTSFGTISKINKLVLLNPIFRTKYKPAIGDMIIGVIEKVGNKRWFLDINSIKCILNTSAIIQPSSDIKTDIIMRDHLNIGDIIICEVQKIGKSISVHTHQQNYGKREGILLRVPVFMIINSFIFESIKKDFKVIIGLNGLILISGINNNKKDKIIKYIKLCREEIKIIKENEIRLIGE